MALSELQRARVTKRLTEYCDNKIRPDVRDRLRLGFRLEASDVVLFEERPRFDRPREWQQDDIAKFRYVASRRQWRLYCQFRDLKWHEYKPRFTAPSFEELLQEVDQDPTGIFWG
jgi:hypothetical protein